ncbi:metallophosphoesterase family protein [Albibacterium indicum]|uniref:metallophosphoesterase family protein n=1 Tax=Albibacterium indicum TaxID=2292082 RepID=UPI000E51720B|nr:metallophosphoesterase [Pedobacter indicus]
MSISKPTRRSFLQLTGVGALTSLISPLDVFAGAELAKVMQVTEFEAPYLQNLGPEQVAISVVDTKDAVTWVELTDGGTTRKIVNQQDGFLEAGKGPKTFKINNLVPGKEYSYRVYRKEITLFKPYDLQYGETRKTKDYTFRTPSPSSESVSCLIMNDIHDRPHSFAHLMALNSEPYDFVVFNGDTFDYQTDEAQLIDHLFLPTSALFSAEKPMLMIRGNHETRGKYARDFKNYFSYPDNQYYFSFQQGPVHFIVLDTGEDKPDDAEVYGGIVNFDAFREEQARWLEELMRSKAYRKSPYKVVFMHIPPFHSGDWHGTMHCRELFAPLFEKYKVDLVISGHTHRYGIHQANNEHSFPIVIGGGPQEGKRTIIHLTADKSKLSISMKDDSGRVVGELTI